MFSSIRRRDLLKLTGAVVAGSFWEKASAFAGEKPNIIFIMADDHALETISSYGSYLADYARTPNIDRLASEGCDLLIGDLNEDGAQAVAALEAVEDPALGALDRQLAGRLDRQLLDELQTAVDTDQERRPHVAPRRRVALGIEQLANAAEQRDIVRAVVAPPAAPLERLHLRKLGLPESENVLRNIERLRHFADGSKRTRRLAARPALRLGSAHRL